MWIAILFFALQIMVIVLFAPIKVGASGYFCLKRENLMLDFKIFDLTVARIRIFRVKGAFLIKINDRQLNLKSKNSTKRLAKKVVKYASNGNLAIKSDLLAVFGDVEAKTSALIAGAIMTICRLIGTKIRVYNDFESERADAQFGFATKISIYQTIEMLI